MTRSWSVHLKVCALMGCLLTQPLTTLAQDGVGAQAAPEGAISSGGSRPDGYQVQNGDTLWSIPGSSGVTPSSGRPCGRITPISATLT